MNFKLLLKLVSILLVVSASLLGYVLTSVSGMNADPDYDLTIDNIPVNFDDEKTLYLDTQTNDRGFVIYQDYLLIRSSYLTFYDLNDSYVHEDVNLVIGNYAYATVPARNATLDSITEINRFELSSWNGTVSVQCSAYGTTRMTLEVNSTDNATLLIRAVGLHRNYEYRVLVDDQPVDWLRVNDAQYIEYNYTGEWSNHTISFVQYGQAVEVPSQSLYLIQVMLCLGVVAVVLKSMVLPLVKSRKTISNDILFKTTMKAMVYIVVALFMITLVFKMFVGV